MVVLLFRFASYTIRFGWTSLAAAHYGQKCLAYVTPTCPAPQGPCKGRFYRLLLETMPNTPALTPYGPPSRLAEQISHEWMLDPTITFINHGCFGARPRVVSQAQQAWREKIEARPIELIDRRRAELVEPAKNAVGMFVGANPQDFGFVTNATEGVNAVLQSLRFEPGDELLTVNHVYNAVRQAMRHVAQRDGAKMIELPIPLPVQSPQQLVDAIEAGLTERTRLVVIDHITSPTALIFPVKHIVDLCAACGIDVLVDGAHAPGMVDLDIEALGAAYYSANLHKWACAPMGTAMLWVRPDKQQQIHPTTVSHFYGEGLAAEFAWQGTRDYSGWLSAPAAIEYFEQYGWQRVREHNHQMATWVQAMLCERWGKHGVEPTTPLDGSMIGSMTTLRLPDRVRELFELPEHLHNRLYDGYSIEVPIFDWDDAWWIRASCQIYNTPDHYEYLADALLKILN